jgi:Brp/Blh family beta-carotene 15,15'-monooxygenase
VNASPSSAAARATPLEVSPPAADAGSVVFGPRAFPWAVLATAVALGAANPALTAEAAPVPFAIALVAFGMPHGAADWAVAARLSKRTGFAWRLLGFSGYLALMALSLGFIAWQPSLAALLFLVLTMFHFGMADATALGADNDGAVARWGLALGRGMLLLATAFAADPQAAWAPFAQIGEALSPWSASAWRPDLGALQRFAIVGVAVGAMLAVASAVARARAGHGRIAARDLAEHALVAAMAALADPLFAVGCYFIGVHAFRHTRRLASTSEIVGRDRAAETTAGPISTASRCHGCDETPGFAQRLLRVHFLSLPLMWPTALAFIPLCWLLGGFTLHAITVASIAFYMITTLPHHLLGLKLPEADMPPAATAANDAR